jgi:serine/threonine protein kinase
MHGYLLPDELSRVKCGPIIGTGEASKVTLESHVGGVGEFAVKHVYAHRLRKTEFFREIETQIKLNHPCILRILGFVIVKTFRGAEIHTEFAENGSLESVLKDVAEGKFQSFWNPTGIGIIICGIVLGMRFVHSSGFIHRALDPSNILINGDGKPLISDFETSLPQEFEGMWTPEPGSIHYTAPEHYRDEIECTNKVDVFSFGLILYEILVGSAVFPASMNASPTGPLPVMRLLLKGEMPTIPDTCGSFMKNMISRCWSMNPANRPSFDDILNEFQAQNFQIIPDADPDALRTFVWGVIAWEGRASLEISDTTGSTD